MKNLLKKPPRRIKFRPLLQQTIFESLTPLTLPSTICAHATTLIFIFKFYTIFQTTTTVRNRNLRSPHTARNSDFHWCGTKREKNEKKRRFGGVETARVIFNGTKWWKWNMDEGKEKVEDIFLSSASEKFPFLWKLKSFFFFYCRAINFSFVDWNFLL